ncbi:exopolysaccharide transport family protein [Roseibium sp. MMSF_3544]|uniref:exopolysaccharide transport family protein n=1 Tax=unclassified Roseibium TaxID=2629323 RepID=UPI00273F2653|nr:exopolysaccharide transport family protein [Roseibium sp. MMSF_3544]
MNADRQTHLEDDMALDLGGLLRAIGRSLGWLLPLTLFVSAAIFVGLQFVAPKYKGEARVLIESTDNKFPGASRGIEEERALLDAEGVASQVQLLMSADLARRVAQKLNLAAIPEYEAKGSASLINDLLMMVGLGSDTAGNSEEERVLKHFYENLDIYRLEGSRVIAVDYSAENPVLAAKVANTIVDEYLSLQSSAKRQTTEQASAALEPQIVELRKEVQAARQAVADFRARADLLIGADNIPLNQQQLAETSSDYSAAQASKAEAQAKADLLRELLNSGGSLETASDVLNSALIQRLRERQVEIQSNIAELSITLLPSHPQLKSLQSQLGDYDRQIRAEATKILQGLENDAKVANQQALALEARLEDLKAAAARSNADQARLSELEREANAKAAQLDQLLLSFQEADSRLRAQVLPADARIISRASVPVEPYSPKIISSTIIAALVTLILGIAFVVMREFLTGRALYSVDRGQTGGVAAHPPAASPVEPAVAAHRPATSGQQFASTGVNTGEPFGWQSGYGVSAATYGFDQALGKESTERSLVSEDTGNMADIPSIADPDDVSEETGAKRPDNARMPGRTSSKYDQDVSPDWIGELRGNEDNSDAEGPESIETPAEIEPQETVAAEKAEEQAPKIAPLRGPKSLRRPDDAPEPKPLSNKDAAFKLAGKTTFSKDIDVKGRIVVLSVDDETLSHDLAFDLVRKAAANGASALVVEVFPDQSDAKAAEGFSDVVSGRMPFAKVVYRDAVSKAHIIEAGRVAITDDMVKSDRFKLALDAIRSTYDSVVVDLGAIDGSLASARMLSFADRVLIAASAPDHSHELQSAANLLAHNTGARVEVVIAGQTSPDPRRNGDGHAA